MDQTVKNTQLINLHGYKGNGWLRSSAEIDQDDLFPSGSGQKARYIGRTLGCLASLTTMSVFFALVLMLLSSETFWDALGGSTIGVIMGAIIVVICMIPRWYMQMRHGLTKAQAQYWSSNKPLRDAMKHHNTDVSRAKIIAAAEAADRSARPVHALEELYKRAKQEAERSGIPAAELLKGALAKIIAEVG
jgi:fluoride ion exporter CrcB/FEX